MPFRFYPCMIAGLAYYIALKKSPQRVQMLKVVYEEEFQRASDEDEDRTSLKLQPSIEFLRFNEICKWKDAYGISDRSGFRYRLRDMRKEWNGF